MGTRADAETMHVRPTIMCLYREVVFILFRKGYGRGATSVPNETTSFFHQGKIIVKEVKCQVERPVEM